MSLDTWQTIEASRAGLGLSESDTLVIIPAASLVQTHIPQFPPSLPALVTDLAACNDITRLLAVLYANYDADQEVRLIRFSSAGTMDIQVEDCLLSAVHQSDAQPGLTHLFLPARDKATAFEAFQEVVARLRAPDGCPWDLKQTHQSLRSHLLSETYEVLSALDGEDIAGMCEEFGDLLLQIVLHAQIAMEAGEFRMTDILQGVNQKIVHRHPHVFGDLQLQDERGVLQNWERLKAAERSAKNGSEGQEEAQKGMLDGVPLALPALIQAQEYFERVERVGIHWLSEEEIVRRIKALAETVSIDGKDGDENLLRLVFAVANLASIHQHDAEALLREANSRVRSKVRAWEARARETNVALAECISAGEMRKLWDLEVDPPV